MNKRVEFFFDVGSPASYLAWTQLPALCAAAGAELAYRPMLLGGVYQATGNASPATIKIARRWIVRNQRLRTQCHCRQMPTKIKIWPITTKAT